MQTFRKQRQSPSATPQQNQDRQRELAQIGAGLAHEIRNPLHALRINLHTLRRSFGSRAPLPPDQLLATFEESESAIERLDELMHDLLQYTDRSIAKAALIDLVDEVRAALDLKTDELRRAQITVTEKLPAAPATIAFNPVRLRQVLLLVLTLAQNRAGHQGSIQVEIREVDSGIELSVGDSGPQLAEEQRARIFEPFQAPVETGSGLGLALAQVHVEEAGGRAAWDDSAAAGRCCLWFPAVAALESKAAAQQVTAQQVTALKE